MMATPTPVPSTPRASWTQPEPIVAPVRSSVPSTGRSRLTLRTPGIAASASSVSSGTSATWPPSSGKPSADDTIHGANQARRRNAGLDGQDDPGMAGRRVGAPSQRRVEPRVPRVGRAARGCRGGCHETRNGQEERSNHLEQSGGNRRQTAPELQSDCPSRRSGRRLLTVLIPGLYRWKPGADSFRPCAVCQRSVLFQNNDIQK